MNEIRQTLPWKDRITIILSLLALTVSALTFYRSSIYEHPSIQFVRNTYQHAVDRDFFAKDLNVSSTFVNDGTTDVMIMGANVVMMIDGKEDRSYSHFEDDLIKPTMLKAHDIQIISIDFPELGVDSKTRAAQIRLEVYLLDAGARLYTSSVPIAEWDAQHPGHLEFPQSLLIQLLTNKARSS